MNDGPAPSPMRSAREGLGLSRLQMALATGLAVERIAAAELGYLRKIPDSWAPSLAAAGIADPAGLIAAYDAWRTGLAAAHVERSR